MREVEINAHKLAIELLAELLDQLFLGQSLGPLFLRLERHEELGHEGAVGIGRILTAALLRNDGADRRIAPDNVAHARDAVHAGFERDRRRQQGADPHVAFLQLRQELGAEPGAQHGADQEEHGRDDRRYAIAPDDERQGNVVDAPDLPHQPGLDFGHPCGQQNRGHDRRHREGRDHGTKQRIGIGARHRTEDLAFHALHGEQWQEGCDRNEHREEDRFIHLDRAVENTVQPLRQAQRRRLVSGAVVRQMTIDVLQDDDGRIDDDAKIDRAD